MQNPGESSDYRAARERLLEKEIALRRAMEDVAAARRALPPGGEVLEDYVFETASGSDLGREVRLSELFALGKDSLLIYNFMFPRHPQDSRPGHSEGPFAMLPVGEGPCPSCVAFLDQLNGGAPHIEQKVNLAIAAKAPAERIAAVARERGWSNLRLLSSGKNRFKRDYNAETPEGHQMPMMTVFHRDNGRIRHFWSSEMLYAPADSGQDPRHMGTVEPLWNLFDFTREGRPMDWHEQLRYR